MPFTDEDLKRVKERPHWDHTTPCTISLPAQEFKALIARLEAAERVVERISNGDEPFFEDVKAWRKAAGK